MDDWELVLEEFGSRSSLGEVLELLDTVSVAPHSPFWERENSVRDSGPSGNLVHELLPLPDPLFLSTHLSSPEVPWRRTASSLKVGYAGQVVARGLSLVDSMVAPAWPRKEARDFSRSFVSWRDLFVLQTVSPGSAAAVICGTDLASDERSGTESSSLACDSAMWTLSLKRAFSVTTTAIWSRTERRAFRLPCGSTVELKVASRTWCRVTRPCCPRSPAMDMFLSKAKLLKVLLLTNGSSWLSPLLSSSGSAR